MELLPAGFDADVVVGVDEAGRGALAGPIVGAAVAIALSSASSCSFAADSKTLTHLRRKSHLPDIINYVSAYSVVSAPVQLINKMGIQYCNRLVLERAIVNVLKNLKANQDRRILVIVDHFKLQLPGLGSNTRLFSVPKADAKFAPVAMASVLAKCTRDLLLEESQELFPGYNFRHHRGYGTKEHFAEIELLGASRIHRTCFKPVSQMKLF